MAVISTVIGQETLSDEYIYAERLNRIISESMPDTAIGEIKILPNVTLYGQSVKDIDILLIGQLSNFSVPVSFEHNGNISKDFVCIENFCTTVEIKSHSADGIMREGTNWLVRYGENWHNVTKQSNDQKYSAKNFFQNAIGGSPYITNLIWFTGITREELDDLSRTERGSLQTNALPSSFSLEEMFQLISWQRLPKYYGDSYRIVCTYGGFETDAIVMSLMNFFEAKAGMGVLTRKKIEQITAIQLDKFQDDLRLDHFTILRGRAGTGKTIALLRMGVYLVEELQQRAMILTYNRALVADIRRLLALSDLPDMFEAQCLSVNTMQSYFFGIVNICLFNGRLTGKAFLDHYDELLRKMCDFIRLDANHKKIVEDICYKDPKLFWNYILIDEAQDWTKIERDLIFLLFDESHILVADGGQQFVRQIEPCDWSIIPDRKNIKLKYCIRQKENLIHFINALNGRFGVTGTKILSSEKLPGGNIIVVRNKSDVKSFVKEQYENLSANENSPYDLLILASPSLVENEYGKKNFVLRNDWEKDGILLWDGTNDGNRMNYPTDPQEARVIQYESARGLEGWTVVCLNFDEFLESKEHKYIPDENTLMLESAEEQKKRYLVNWLMVPLTRAIDTLIIGLDDSKSKYSLLLLELANKFPDFVSVI